MPSNPGHTRRIPAGRPLALALSPVLARVRWECLAAIRDRREPSYVLIATSVGNTALPFLQRYALLGAAYSRWYYRTHRRPVAEVKSARTPTFSAAWDVLPPEVVAEARRLAVELAGQIAATVRQQVRDAVAAGVQAGQSVNEIADAVGADTKLDPRRAYTIAQTETSRAVHAGQAAQGRALGSVGLEAIVSGDACEKICLPLSGKQVRYGQPFYINPKPGPYSVVTNAPFHVGCYCTTVDVYAEEWRGET